MKTLNDFKIDGKITAESEWNFLVHSGAVIKSTHLGKPYYSIKDSNKFKLATKEIEDFYRRDFGRAKGLSEMADSLTSDALSKF